MNLFDVYPLFDLEIVQGRGAWVYDKTGNKYLDFYGGHAVISIGHAHPHYVNAIQSQVSRLGFYSNSVENPLQEKLASLLGEISGFDDYQLFLVNSGAEANENALKLASFHNGRSKVISFSGAFHGRTSAAVNVTDNPRITAPINEGFENVALPLNDQQAVERELATGDVAAVIIEGIQGIAGIYEAEPQFLKFLQEQTRRFDTVLILDEIQSGYGRTGHFFAFQESPSLQPDLITVAKGMGNGFPIGGVLISPLFEARYGLLGTTFGGNHLACAAGVAVLEVIRKEGLLDHVQKVGEQLTTGLQSIPGVKEVRGRGLMQAIQMEGPVAELRKKLLFEHHLFVGSAADPNTIRILPPLSVTVDEVNLCLDKLEKASLSVSIPT